MSISVTAATAASALRRRTGRTAHRRTWSISACETRSAWSRDGCRAPLPAIQMLSATTTDSKSVTIEYQVNQPITAATPDPVRRLSFSNGQFDSSDSLVDTYHVSLPRRIFGASSVTLDQSGQPATSVGIHQLTIPLPQGLPPYPEKPYVWSSPIPARPPQQPSPSKPHRFAPTPSAS